jgi:3-hydroxyisobutyrate dehydrogenase
MRIGWIGIGMMGRWLAHHILQKGHPLAVFNVPKETASELVSQGAKFMSVPEMANFADIVFTMVGGPADVEKVYLGKDGLLANMRPGSLAVDHTSSSPELAEQLADEAHKRGLTAIDAPVSGGDDWARLGKLSIMVGGDRAGFERAKPFMDLYAANVRLMGKAGVGQHTKLAGQIVLTGNLVGIVEGFLYAHKAGLDLQQMFELVSTGAAGSNYYKTIGPQIIKGDYSPGFYVQHLVKDLGMVLGESKRMGIVLPGTTLAYQFYCSMMAHGEEKLGCHALIKVLERLNNTCLHK